MDDRLTVWVHVKDEAHTVARVLDDLLVAWCNGWSVGANRDLYDEANELRATMEARVKRLRALKEHVDRQRDREADASSTEHS